MQSVPITSEVVISNPVQARCTRHYVIKFVSDLRQVSGFLHLLNRQPRYNWNIVKSAVKHHNPNPVIYYKKNKCDGQKGLCYTPQHNAMDKNNKNQKMAKDYQCIKIIKTTLPQQHYKSWGILYTGLKNLKCFGKIINPSTDLSFITRFKDFIWFIIRSINHLHIFRGRHIHDCMLVGFTTTCTISVYHH